VLLVIDHRAVRSTLPEDWAAELYNATLSFIAPTMRASSALLHRPAMSGRDNSAA
jgi:hypothetical protein